MPAPHHSVFFTGWMPFLPPSQQRQSSEGTTVYGAILLELESAPLSEDTMKDMKKVVYIIWTFTLLSTLLYDS